MTDSLLVRRSDGARIAYRRRGEGERTLVFGHNILCDRRVFDAVIDRLEGFRTIAIDFRGHGESTSPRRYEVRDLVDDLHAVLEAERIERATLVGLSIGATVSMSYTLAHRERIDRLVLLGATCVAEQGRERIRDLLQSNLLRVIGTLPLVRKAIMRSLFGRSFRHESKSIVDAWSNRVAKLGGRGIARATRAWTLRPELSSRIGAIAVPTLVISGEEDVANPVREGERIARAIPNARLVRIPRAGHTMTVERPDAIAEVLRGFLDEAG